MNEVLLSKQGAGAFITFNRPKESNALNPDMLKTISKFISSLRQDEEARYLVIEGAGKNFSAGGDLAVYAKTLELPDIERKLFFEERVRGNAECFIQLNELSIPTISILRGAAAGAGLSFLLASDFVLAAEDSVLIFAQTRIGLPLDLSLTYHLPRKIGVNAARKLALTGARIDAQLAMHLGIVDETHPSDQLSTALANLTEQFNHVAPKAAARSKQLINTSEGFDLKEQMEREVQAIGECVIEPDFREGVEEQWPGRVNHRI